MTRHLLFLFALALLSGCVTTGGVAKFLEEKPDKAAPLVKHYLDEHEHLAAAYCAGAFRPQVRLIPGHVVTKTDTARLPGLELPCDHGHLVRCPGTETITVDNSRVDTLEVPNLARERELELELGMKNLEIHDLNGEKKHLQGRVSKQGKTILHLTILYAGTLFTLGAFLYFLSRR